MAVILSIANEKGGVGKTTVAANLAAGFAHRGYRTLAVDFDPQSDMAERLLCEMGQEVPSWQDRGLYPLLLERSGKLLPKDVLPSSRDNLFVVPVAKELSQQWHAVRGKLGHELFLRNALRHPHIQEAFDVIVIDTPGTADGHITWPLIASDYVLCPIELQGTVDKGAETIRAFVEAINEALEAQGATPQYLGLLAIQRNRSEWAQTGHYKGLTAEGKFFCEAEIQKNAAIGRQHAFRQTSFDLDPETAKPLDKKGRADFDAVVSALVSRFVADEKMSAKAEDVSSRLSA